VHEEGLALLAELEGVPVATVRTAAIEFGLCLFWSGAAFRLRLRGYGTSDRAILPWW
jgi:hypothetical protein